MFQYGCNNNIACYSFEPTEKTKYYTVAQLPSILLMTQWILDFCGTFYACVIKTQP